MKNTFKKSERLKNSREIGALLSAGQDFNSYPLKVFWKVVPGFSEIFPARVAFVVPKKNFKRAVDRNLIKRRLRESFRTNKHQMYDLLIVNNIGLKLVFIYIAKEIYSYDKISNGMQNALIRLSEKLSNGFNY